jgi:hypothetical protein
MGRKSLLSDSQWREAEKRHIAGETVPDLARAYKVGIQTMRDRVAKRTEKVKRLANQIATAETEISTEKVTVREDIRTLVDEMKDISKYILETTKNGAMTSAILSGHAFNQTSKINADDPMESQDVLQAISALTKMSNDAGSMAVDLIKINREAIKPDDDTGKLLFETVTRTIIKPS